MRPFLRYLPLAGTFLSLLEITAAQNTVTVQLSASPPPGASDYISPSFAGFGIEPSNLFSFTGDDNENQLTRNLLENLAGYTGTPPHLRIGGNTQDYFIWQEDQDEWAWVNNADAVGQGNFPTDHMIIGPRYFEALNRFPRNTPMTFGLNLAYSEPDYIEQITTMATQAVERLTDVNLVSLEIGNEPDLYLGNGFRSGAWNGQIYTQQWLDRANAIWSQVLEPRGFRSNFFEPGTTASTIGTSFQLQNLYDFGITVPANGSSETYVASWNQHDYYYYIGVSTYPLTQFHFMTLSTTRDQFQAWEEEIRQGLNLGYPYALREMGVVGPIGLHEITDVFGAALWTLNFFLYAATLNISSVQMHMTDNSNASAWQPIEFYGNQPFVRPNYYGFAAFDQTIGATCQAQIASVDVAYPTDYGGRLAVYPVYQDGTLASIVLINSNEANVSETNKASVTFELELDSQFGGEDLYLAYLTNDGADAQFGTTWNGLSFEESGDGTPTEVQDEGRVVTIGNDGRVSVTVRDTQAIIANIGQRVGEREPNTSACSALAERTPDATPSSTETSSDEADGSTSTSASSAPSSSSSSQENTASRTGSSPTASTTNGVTGLSNMMLSTVVLALTSIIYLVLV